MYMSLQIYLFGGLHDDSLHNRDSFLLFLLHPWRFKMRQNLIQIKKVYPLQEYVNYGSVIATTITDWFLILFIISIIVFIT